MDATVKRVAVVATGVIGQSWTACFLARGLEVAATDPAPGAEERLRDAVAAHWPALERRGLAPGASLERLHFHPRLEEAVAQADFVQENGPERLELKADLLRRIDEAAPPESVIASSSSGLPVTALQAHCGRPERVVLGHPFNPPHLIPLVEVGGGERTAPHAIAVAMAFYASLGKRPIHVRREIKGHIANRLQAALWREAFHLVQQGVASVADIDAAITQGPGLRWALLGPFANLHLSGGEGGMAHLLEHLGGPIEDWWHDLGSPQLTPTLCRQVTEGVQDALHGKTSAQWAQARDGLLVDLLQLRQASSALP